MQISRGTVLLRNRLILRKHIRLIDLLTGISSGHGRDSHGIHIQFPSVHRAGNRTVALAPVPREANGRVAVEKLGDTDGFQAGIRLVMVVGLVLNEEQRTELGGQLHDHRLLGLGPHMDHSLQSSTGEKKGYLDLGVGDLANLLGGCFGPSHVVELQDGSNEKGVRY